MSVGETLHLESDTNLAFGPITLRPAFVLLVLQHHFHAN